MLRAPLLVCILIAGADGDIDQAEVKKAIETARKKAAATTSLMEYYRHVVEDFEDKLKVVLQDFPVETTQRSPLVVEELTRLNPVLNKLGKKFAADFYQSILEMAKKTAESSGGVLGIKAVGAQEARYVSLPMIKNPSL